jgi:hypothetical protein
MKRTGNIRVDRQWLSNVGLLWTVVKIDAQHGFHPTTLRYRILQYCPDCVCEHLLLCRMVLDF